jgi:DNA repair protein RadD
MLLRHRQAELVNRAVEALNLHGNTLAVAPTGAGKTIMLSATIGEMAQASPPLKACVLAHRDELTAQNAARFSLVNPHLTTSIFDASVKSWQPTVDLLSRNDSLGNTTFAMVQTLSRENNLATMPPLDLLVIDEAHHARSESYLRIISHARALNPDMKLLGMTATPNRGDKKGLRPIFSNVCDQITVRELIVSGHLVRPRTFVIDMGVQKQLKEVKKTAGDYNMDEVAQIMNTYPINQAVVAHWKEKAGERQTVVFCSTVDHARHVWQGFCGEGVSAVLIHGDMPDAERKQTLKAYTTGAAQVIVNVAVLTEGWDDPLTSCVVLLRPSSYKSTFIQMVGRGLRPVNAEDHPGVVKNDCVVLDFGTATLAHGSLEQDAALDDKVAKAGNAPHKHCPGCDAEVPARGNECPLCGFVFESAEDKSDIKPGRANFAMREIDILRRSPFRWEPVDANQHSFMAAGFDAWGGVFFKTDASGSGQWHAVGAMQKQQAKLLAVGEKSVCFAAADDWMNVHESHGNAHKAKGWLKLMPTPKQLQYLPEHQGDYGLTRYKASALINLKFNARGINMAINNALESQTSPMKEVSYGS